MKEVKDNVVYINGKPMHLSDLCQVVAVSNDMPMLITQFFDFIGTRKECWDKIKSTNITLQKGSHLSVAVFKQYTVERSAW